jgi:hypothetical protein
MDIIVDNIQKEIQSVESLYNVILRQLRYLIDLIILNDVNIQWSHDNGINIDNLLWYLYHNESMLKIICNSLLVSFTEMPLLLKENLKCIIILLRYKNIVEIYMLELSSILLDV